MKKNIKSIFLLFLLLIFLSSNKSNAVSEATAKVSAGIVGVFGAIGIGAATEYVLSDGQKVRLSDMQSLAVAGAGILGGTLIGYLVYTGLYSCTPKARFLRARDIVELIYSDRLFSANFNSYEFVKDVTLRFGTNWPLVLARNYFEGRTKVLNNAYFLLRQAETEAIKDPNLQWICNEAAVLKKQIGILTQTIADRMYIIIDSRDYMDQVKLYERHLDNERQMEFEAKQREKDRLLEREKHYGKMLQEEKARKDRMDFINSQQGNQNINVNLAV